ncbi:hypothetical protein H6P81_013510 [Aristolochia fimbriata]|uniref:Uncharacterized protein n=1 Tax=Aristolochia fimbriata TaxID=158543 RepID=A0AAV7EEX4_ARIFI|nr:hypothetical protein H6P81_013510 [Aristolochia fimbriata]
MAHSDAMRRCRPRCRINGGQRAPAHENTQAINLPRVAAESGRNLYSDCGKVPLPLVAYSPPPHRL